MATRANFAPRLLAWFDRHGRHDLPWQHPRTPYRVWVAEIMLQQTQVAAAIPYFLAFTDRFPDIAALAAAQRDEVMRYWAGLGYYARARNLHAAARKIMADHAGMLPADPDALQALPGIGRSTAGAIAAQAFDRRAAILDANAKRVLARYHAVAGAPGVAAFESKLWKLAQAHTPHERVADYTQAIMDLGATLCLRTAPACPGCPVADGCGARMRGEQERIPAPRRRRPRPLRHTRMLILRRAPDEILFQRRPPVGVWGGLWALPEVAAGDDPQLWCRERLGLDVEGARELDGLRHGFTHFELDIQPLEMQVSRSTGIMDTDVDTDGCAWYPRQELPALPAPIAKLISKLSS